MASRAAVALLLVLTSAALAGCPRFQRSSAELPRRAGHVILGAEKVFVLDQPRTGGAAARGTLLLIHGYGSAHHTYKPIIGALRRGGYRVLAVDLPGFGASDKLRGDYSPPALARKLLTLLDKKGVRRAHLVGHSWGASVALAAALAAPKRVRTLTLIGAWVFEEQLPAFIRWSRTSGVGELLYGLFFDQRVADRMELAFHDAERFVTPAAIDKAREALAAPGATAAALAAARGQHYAEIQKRYASLKQPALLIWGRQDRVSALSFGRRLARTLPDARLRLIDACGHVPMLEQPRVVERLMLRFLRRHGATASAAATPARTVAPAPTTATPANTTPPPNAKTPTSRPKR